MPQINNLEKRKEWEALISEQERGELSQKAFCKKQNISPSNFAYYRKRLRGEDRQKSLGAFTPVNVSKSSGAKEIRLILPNGFQCLLSPDLELTRIKELVRMCLSC